MDDYLWGENLISQDRPLSAIDSFLDIYKSFYELLFMKYQVAIKKIMWVFFLAISVIYTVHVRNIWLIVDKNTCYDIILFEIIALK